MIQVSDAYKELVKSNIRPKCEPIIKVSGKDNNGNDIELIWKAKNIKDLKYKRGIDPVGRELPYMELTWTEIYTGKLNAENYPEKYNNIAKYMEVELSFVQDLGFYNTWKTIFKGGIIWKDLLSKTWKQVKNSVSQETISMPKMFLTARPIINGQTITWVARDFLYFLEGTEIKFFDGEKHEINYVNPLRYLILNARSEFIGSPLFDAITYTDLRLKDYGQEFSSKFANGKYLFDGKLKDHLKNYVSIWNQYWDFESNGNGMINDILYWNDTELEISKNLMYSFPTVTFGTDISSYEFKRYVLEKNDSKIYDKIPNETMEISGITLYKYNYDGYGTVDNGQNEGFSNSRLKETINFAISLDNTTIKISPINYSSYGGIIQNGSKGETFSENNPLNPFDENFYATKDRLSALNEYFNKNTKTIECECLPILCLETGDTVNVNTNLFNGNSPIIEKGVIVNFEINYNGAIKEKIVVHTEGESA
jgi:hypothetical protein